MGAGDEQYGLWSGPHYQSTQQECLLDGPNKRVKLERASHVIHVTNKCDHVNDTANECSSHTSDMVPSCAVLAGVKTGHAWLDGRLRLIVPGDRQGRVPTGKEMRGAAKIVSEVQHGRDSRGRARARPGSRLSEGPRGWGPKNLSPARLIGEHVAPDRGLSTGWQTTACVFPPGQAILFINNLYD
jgi:hypothetical protein